VLSPEVQAALPHAAVHELVALGMQTAPSTVVKILDGMKKRIDDVFDVKAMSLRVILNNKDILVKIFMDCGAEELDFIRQSGFYLGFMFGLVQSAVYVFYREWWILPVFGLLVGWLTNQVALFVLFKPIDPTTCCWREKCCGYYIQGLFLQPERRKEVARIYSKLVGETILRAKNIIEDLEHGEGSLVLWGIITKVVSDSTDEMLAGAASSFANFLLGEGAIDKVKHIQSAMIMKSLPKIMLENEDYMMKQFDVTNQLHKKLKDLSPAKFEKILHSVFEEDEI